MTYAPLYYTGDGAQTDFNITWDYILESHVKVYITNVLQSGNYSFPSAGTIRMDSAPANGAAIEIRRITPASPLLVEWADGAPILGADLNKATKQAIYAAEEATYERSILLEWEGQWVSGTAYEVNDAVSLIGSSYVCILSHTSSATDEPNVGVNWATYWDTIASKGDPGPSGAGTGDMLAATYDPGTVAEQLVGLTATQTLTNKTLTSPVLNTPALSASSIDSITEIAAALKTGVDTKLVTGTAGSNAHLAQWNVDGDLVTAGKGAPSGDVVGTTDAQTLSNKTISSPTVNIGSDATGDVYYRAAGGNLQRLAVGTNGNVLTVASGLPSWAASGSGGWTEHANSGQSLTGLADYTFGSIPSTVTEFRFVCLSADTSVAAISDLYLGDSGGIETTGYIGNPGSPAGLALKASATTNQIFADIHGFEYNTNTWSFIGGTIDDTNARYTIISMKSTTATMDRIQIATRSGTFNGGQAFLWYR